MKHRQLISNVARDMSELFRTTPQSEDQEVLQRKIREILQSHGIEKKGV